MHWTPVARLVIDCFEGREACRVACALRSVSCDLRLGVNQAGCPRYRRLDHPATLRCRNVILSKATPVPSSIEGLELCGDDSSDDWEKMRSDLPNLLELRLFFAEGDLVFPPLRSLSIDYHTCFIAWPKSLTRLDIMRPEGPLNLEAAVNLMHLVVRRDAPLGQLPSSLVTLHLGPDFNSPVDLSRLTKLRALSFSESLYRGYEEQGWSSFNQAVDVPDCVEFLDLGVGFDLPVPPLPPRLKWLTIGNCISGDFNRPLPALPETLTRLLLPEGYDQPITKPPHLKELRYGPEAAKGILY